MNEICETPINILGFFNENEGVWSAVALELDLWGYGETKEESIEELVEMIQAQQSFSEFKENPDLLLRSAPAMYFHMYAQAHEEALRANIRHEKIERDTFAGGMSLSEISEKHYAVAH
ncbi:hypothetical protein MNBD_GAMMA10-2973 [hydrothermal vent metagenome]|uniref:Uncharacterized protein n=1 Tax=hydrothermal vent metagenome TaxID=652676 RepID=A0A3B0X7D0_9ZZZZ